MKAGHLFVQFGVTLAVLLGLNVLVQRLAATTLPRQLLRRCEQSAPVMELFLGNSTMQAGLDEVMFNATLTGRTPLNAALGSTSPVEHYLIYSELDGHPIAALYYGFFDTQLTDPPDGDWATLVGNRALAYYVHPDLAFSLYAPEKPLKAFLLGMVSHVPVLVERQTIWAKVERVRRVLGAIGLPSKTGSRFGRAEDFALLEPQDGAEFAKRCRQAVACQVPLNAAIAAMLRRATLRGTRAYIVEVPMPAKHRQAFYSTPDWAKYRAHLTRLVSQAGGVYLSAADWVADEGFADPLHLNPAGAKVFTRRLAQWIGHQDEAFASK